MTFIAARRLEHEAIVIATYGEQVTAHDVQASDRFIAPLFEAIGQDAVLIIDIRTAETSFAEIFSILRARRDMVEEHSARFRVMLILVGTASMAKLYVDAANQKQFGAQQIPLFATLEDAIVAAGVTLARRKAERAT